MKKITAAIFLVLLLSLPIQVARAESVATNVSADADVRSKFPTTTFGSGSHNYLFRSSADGSVGRLFLKFPLPSIPAGSTITQAYIIFKTFADDCYGTPSAAYVAAAASDWSESTLNWNNQPQPQNASTFIYPCEANGWVAAPALDIISQMIAGSRPNYGFIVYGSESGNWQRSVYSKEYDGYTNMAYMYLMYNPPAPPADNPGTPSGGSTTGSSSTTTSSTTTSTGTAVGNKAAPAKTTSTAISAPANLLLEDISSNSQNLVKLTWDKSTTKSITGYKIFRSEKSDADFQNIALTDPNTLSFTDTLDAGKSYYYKVRAYKGSDESADSNIVNFSPKVEAAPVAAPEKKLSLKDKIINFIKSTTGKITIAAILLLIVAAAVLIAIKIKSLAKKNQTTEV